MQQRQLLGTVHTAAVEQVALQGAEEGLLAVVLGEGAELPLLALAVVEEEEAQHLLIQLLPFRLHS